MQQRYNAIIIGFGKGGKTLAAYLADQGQSVAIVERSDKMYGGTCINIACIPTKTLVYEAHKSLCRGERSFEEKAADYRRAIARKNEVTGFLRGKNYAMLADRDNVDVITGTASFVSPHEVEVKTADKTLLLSGERIFINTGGETVIPPIEGVRENPRVYTSTTMLELEDLPRRLVILGGGYIALEFASFYAEFGSRVTILERGSRFLAREDADVADSVRKALENKGVTIITGASASAVRDAGDEAEVRFILDGTEQALPADAILLARPPPAHGGSTLAAVEDNGTRRDCRTNACKPPFRISGLSATSKAARSSRTFRWTTSASSGMPFTERASASPATAIPRIPYSWTPLSVAWGSRNRPPATKTSTSRLPSFLRQPSPAPG
ncbi:MAG: FAD-dependent oxidoreductase [Bilophila wadsworthia]